MLNNVIKFSVGRLRPHFLDVCKPDIDVSHFDLTQPPVKINMFVRSNTAFSSLTRLDVEQSRLLNM